jgi:hypothetical protein
MRTFNSAVAALTRLLKHFSARKRPLLLESTGLKFCPFPALAWEAPAVSAPAATVAAIPLACPKKARRLGTLFGISLAEAETLAGRDSAC